MSVRLSCATRSGTCSLDSPTSRFRCPLFSGVARVRGVRGGCSGKLRFPRLIKWNLPNRQLFCQSFRKNPFFLGGVNSKKTPFELKICRTRIRFFSCQPKNAALECTRDGPSPAPLKYATALIRPVSCKVFGGRKISRRLRWFTLDSFVVLVSVQFEEHLRDARTTFRGKMSQPFLATYDSKFNRNKLALRSGQDRQLSNHRTFRGSCALYVFASFRQIAHFFGPPGDNILEIQ